MDKLKVFIIMTCLFACMALGMAAAMGLLSGGG